MEESRERQSGEAYEKEQNCEAPARETDIVYVYGDSLFFSFYP